MEAKTDTFYWKTRISPRTGEARVTDINTEIKEQKYKVNTKVENIILSVHILQSRELYYRK